MRCAWETLLGLIPQRMRQEVDRLGQAEARELRLRLGKPPELVLGTDSSWLSGAVMQEELQFVVNAASRYSPWAAQTISKGYLSTAGGHRIGLCGEAVVQQGVVTGVRQIHSLCIRIARDFPEWGRELETLSGSLLIAGAPGWGKTTLLRNVARWAAQRESVSVVDERGELFPHGFSQGARMDVLTGCPKREGIEWVLRTMGPSCIAVDEITAPEDAAALLEAAGCGVRLLATVHAVSEEDLCSRRIYRLLVQQKVFDTWVFLKPNQHYQLERVAK